MSLSGDGTTVDLSDLVNPDMSGYATTTQLANQLSQTITNGVTTKAPSEDAVFDALAGKASVSGTNNYIMKKTGANTLGNSSISATDSSISVNGAQNTYNWLGTTVNSSFSLKGRSSGISNDSPFSIFNSNNDAIVKFNNDGRLDLSSTNNYGSVMVLNNSHAATVNQMTGHLTLS